MGGTPAAGPADAPATFLGAEGVATAANLQWTALHQKDRQLPPGLGVDPLDCGPGHPHLGGGLLLVQAQVVHQMKELRDKYGVTIILVTHNMGVASYLSDKIGVMCRSKMVEFGTRDEIIYHPKEQYTKDLLEAVPKMGGERFAK